VNGKLYRKVAKSDGITVKELKRDMQTAYVKTNFHAGRVPHKGATSTFDEFIAYAVGTS
jgi:hypothetical protein